MLESSYISFTIISSVLLVLSLFSEKWASKLILSGISSMMFWALSLSSYNIEFVTCTTSICSVQSIIFEGGDTWIFWSLGTISGVLMLVFILLASFDYNKGGNKPV